MTEEKGKPDNPGRRKWINRVATGTGATLLGSGAALDYIAGRSLQITNTQEALPGEIAKDYTSRNFPQVKAESELLDKYGSPLVFSPTPPPYDPSQFYGVVPLAAGLHGVSRLAQALDNHINPEPQPPMSKKTRREFMKSGVEAVADAAVLGTGAVALYNAAQYQEVQSMREHLPSDIPSAQKAKIDEVLDRGEKENVALIGNSLTLGAAAVAVGYMERVAREKNSPLATPNERS